MENEEKILNLLEKMYIDFNKRFEGIDSRFGNIESELVDVKQNMATKDELAEVKAEVSSIKAIVVKIENDLGQKLGALFDGYKLNSAEVSKHEEIILRRIR